MPSLQELTLAHSKRLSEVYRTRDIQLADAQATRDQQLRAVPAAAKLYQKYDDQLADTREKQLAIDGRAEAARSAALMTAVDRRSEALEDAQIARRAADVDAVTTKRRMESAAESKYLAAVTRVRELPESQRGTARQDAERARRQELDEAKRAHDQALTASQQAYRNAVDDAVLREHREGRDGERAYLEALRFGEAAARAARTAADQNLLAALSALPDAKAIVRGWRERVAAIGKETAEAEKEEFSRFRRELQGLRV
ncbi:MAG TPA: hypothetical protein VF239_08100 [Vicinamibacterales bacterium]